MHRIITASALALALLASGCEGQTASEPRADTELAQLDEGTEAGIRSHFDLNEPGCLSCLINDEPCPSRCDIRIPIKDDDRLYRIYSDTVDGPSYADPEAFKRTVTSINGKPIRTKDVSEMAIGETGWTAPHQYDEASNLIDADAIVFDQRTRLATMRIKRTRGGFEITMPEDKPAEQKTGSDCVKDKAI